MTYDSILFDLDGTLWDASSEVTGLWLSVLQEQPDIHTLPTQEQIAGVMGLSSDLLMPALFPDLPFDRGQEIFKLCAQRENDYLRLHGATLYPGVTELVTQLAASYPLFIVSNCNSGYIEAFLSAHQLQAFFTDWACYGDAQQPKSENIKTVVARNQLQHPLYVGDTQWDYEAATAAGVPFVLAGYGFGTVPHVPVIAQPLDLLTLLAH